MTTPTPRLLIALTTVWAAYPPNAEAHGGEEAFFAIGVVIVICLLFLLVFLALWRAPLRRKLALLVIYLASYPAAWFTIMTIGDVFPSTSSQVLIYSFLAAPIVVFFVGWLVLRKKPNLSLQGTLESRRP